MRLKKRFLDAVAEAWQPLLAGMVLTALYSFFYRRVSALPCVGLLLLTAAVWAAHEYRLLSRFRSYRAERRFCREHKRQLADPLRRVVFPSDE